MNTATGAELMATAKRALQAVADCDSDEHHDWCIFAPDARAWRFGPDELRQEANLH